MAGLGSLTIDLAANITRFERSLNRAERLADKRAKGITRTFKRMAVGIGVAVSSFGLIRAIDNTLDFADSIGKAADRAGIATGKLQELRFAADQFGISTQQLDDGMRRFTRRLGVALDGGSFAKDFSELGVAIRDVNGNIRQSGDVFDDVVLKMGDLESAAQKSKVAAQLFGDDTGPQLALLMGQGSAAIDQFALKARSLGLIMDEQLIRNAEAANDELSILSQVLKIQLTSAIVELAPQIRSIATDLIGLASGVAKFFASFDESASRRTVETIERLQKSIETAKLAVRVAQTREQEGGFDFFGLKQSSETAQKSLDDLEEKLLAAELRLGEINLRIVTNNAGKEGSTGEVVNPLTGMTEAELQASNDRTIAQIQGLADNIRQVDAIMSQQLKAAEQDVADFREQTRSSSVSNGIALLRVFGRESKSAALTALAIEKSLAIATAIAGTQAAMAKSRIIDPTGALATKIGIEGALNVATIAALGLAQASQINSSFGGSSPTGSINDPFAVDTDPFATTTGGTVGTLTFNINGVVTPEIMESLIIPAIQDAVGSKDVILFNSDSRQALELA